ncbi:MAG: tetratricopeptide repeat protein [Leptolyngbyaceae cyanobacterium]
MTLPVQARTQIQGETLNYSDSMSLGYSAHQAGRYYEATQYFRYALYLVPNDEAATAAYWNAYDLIEPDTETINVDQLMNQGYDATEAGNYQSALESFEQALALRPGSPYASQAILNVQTYLNYGDGLASDPALTLDFSESGPAMDAYVRESAYDRYMRLGYAALQREEYQTSASYFRSALYERPEDRLATLAYWNAINGSQDGEAGLGSETSESPYDRYMRLGYDATQRGDYQAAVDFFEEALTLRPGDYYAIEAIDNVTTYMN